MSTAVTPARPPWWVTVIDAACLALIALLLRALLGGGMRVTLWEGMRLSFSSWPRLLLWTTGLLVLRHIVWRQIPWHVRVGHWAIAFRRSESVRAASLPYVVSRLMVLTVAYVAVMTIGASSPQATPVRVIDNDVMNLFARFDAGWYTAIARSGYPTGSFDPTRQNSIAFFPGFPLLIRAAAIGLDVDRWIAGVLIVVVGFFFALIYLYRLAREDLPPDQASASLMFLAFYPFAVCYSAILTEPVFLLVVAAAFLYVRRGEWNKAAPFALFAGLLRPNGFLLALPLGLITLSPSGRTNPGTGRHPLLFAKLAVAALPIVGMLAYSVYVRSLTGEPFAWVETQQGWGRSSGGMLKLLETRRAQIAADGWSAYVSSHPVEILEGLAGVFALISVWPIIRRFGLPYGVFVLVSVLPPLSMGTLSVGRFTAPLFPIFLWLGAIVREPYRPYVIATFAGFQALVAALFFTGRPPY